MTSERLEIIELVNQAQSSGERLNKACDFVVGISAKTLQDWEQPDNFQDSRIETKHKPKKTY